jgi:hypothetical protein
MLRMLAKAGFAIGDAVGATSWRMGEALGKLSNVTHDPGAAMRWESQTAWGIV